MFSNLNGLKRKAATKRPTGMLPIKNHFRYKDIHRLKVKDRRKIFHVNRNKQTKTTTTGGCYNFVRLNRRL